MGNRAYITTEDKKIGLYLHWNGGRDSVEAFLKYCDLKGYVSPERDGYGWARLAQVVGNFFGGTTSVGIEPGCWDPGDNGIYIIKDWQIVGRECYEGSEQQEYPLDEMLDAIDERQPVTEQIAEYLHAEEINIKDYKIGDTIIFRSYRGFEKAEVIGIGERGKVLNGQDIDGLPYIGKYGPDNINSYIRPDDAPRRFEKDAQEEEQQEEQQEVLNLFEISGG